MWQSRRTSHRPTFPAVCLCITASFTGRLAAQFPQVVYELQEGSSVGPVEAPWPMIDLIVTEDGTRDPSQSFTLRILAAPRAELVPYELVKGSLEDSSGSRLEVICPPCEFMNPYIPLEGTLLVGL